MSPPEFVNYDEIYFSYRKGGETYEELKINDLVTSKSVTSSTVLRTVKGWRIHRYRVEGDVYAGYWRAYDCYVAEVDLETKHIFLSNGHWFQISQDIKDRIDLLFQRSSLIIVMKFCRIMFQYMLKKLVVKVKIVKKFSMIVL